MAELKEIFQRHDEVKVAYFFGSQAANEAGPMSDFDFAVFLGTKDPKTIYGIKFALMDELGRLLGTDKIDVVVLDTAMQPELKYRIIKDGILLKEVEPYRVELEPRIMNEYFDFRIMTARHVEL